MARINSTFLAVVPARAGSKGLPGKNKMKLAGSSLVERAVNTATQCPADITVLITTDDADIKVIGQTLGALVVGRPDALAGDTAPIEAVIRHAIENAPGDQAYEHLILLQPTSPLRNASHLTQALNLYCEKQNCGSLFSVLSEEHHPAKCLLLNTNGDLQPITGNIGDLSAPRQKLPKAYRQNGAIYITKIDLFLKTGRLFNVPCIPFEMTIEDSIDVDTLEDFQRAEYILQTKKLAQ